MTGKKRSAALNRYYIKMAPVLLCALLLAGLLGGCGRTTRAGPASGNAPSSAAAQTPADAAKASAEAAASASVAAQASAEAASAEAAKASADAAAAEKAARQAALEAAQKKAVGEAEALRAQYDYDGALSRLKSPELAGGIVDREIAAIKAEKDSLVNYKEDIPHIFFHSLIVYPEMVFKDKKTPMGGYNAGFSEKAELERMLPQLYARGYVLYDLNNCWDMSGGKMVRKDILLPPGKKPLILSVDDVAYAYGDGFAKALTVKDGGALVYQVKNPEGKIIEMPDGDVMGVLDLFVAKHPDFSYRGHKGTIALTGFQGAFGYSYDTDQGANDIRKVAAALKADGWNFASHSYTHNRTNYYGPNSNPANIKYDVNKWVARVVPCLGPTRLFIAPFGYRVRQPGLQYILDAGFNIYCTVDDVVVNELYDTYALMSRIEMSGYSMAYYKNTLTKLFFNVDEVFDAKGRPPVIG